MDGGLRARLLRGPLSTHASPAELLVAPLVDAARAALEASFDRSIVPVLPAARREVIALLTSRLVAVTARVLVHEQQALDATGVGARLDGTALGWRDRLARYPGLAALVARATSDVCAHADELLVRLGADRALVAGELFGGRPLGALAGFRGDAGDVHDGGRAVALLRFDDGRRLVYKPKDLRVTRGVLELCAWLGADLPLELHVHRLVPRTGYAWEEWVEPAPCRSPGEVARFYTRAGMLVALFELLEARDLWLDNLVAAGEHPAFIDLEMVLQPRRRARATELAAERAAEDRLRDSVVHLGILAMPTLIAPGIAAEQLGALTPARTFLSPFRCVPALEAMTGARRPSRDGFAVWTHDAHVCSRDGAPAHAADQVGALLEGYRAMRGAIAARRDALLAPGGPLDRLAGLPVRVIQRNTWACHRIAQASLAPRLLADPARRAAWLDGLLDGAEGEELAVAREEIAALDQLDVPYFVCRSDGEDLLGPDGRVVARGLFAGSALERVRRRIAEAAPANDDLVRSTLATSLRDPRVVPEPADLAAGEHAPRWIAAATEIGDLLLDAAIRGADGLTWIGLTLDPFHALHRVDVLGPDVLTGIAGIAIVLADLWAATGLERFRDAALGALATTRRSRRDEPLAGAPRAIGAFCGAGARIYALHRCGAALGAPELAAAAAELAASTAIPANATLDVVTGATGLLLASLAAGADGASLAAWIDERLAEPAARRSPYPPELRALDGLPDLAGGLRLVRARAGSAPSMPAAPPAGLRVRLALAGEPGADHPELGAEVRRTLDRLDDELERLELALAAAQALADRELGARAADLGRVIVARRRTTGRWFPRRLAADRHDLSAVHGLAALAHAFLRLEAPSRHASIRLVEPPRGSRQS